MAADEAGGLTAIQGNTATGLRRAPPLARFSVPTPASQAVAGSCSDRTAVTSSARIWFRIYFSLAQAMERVVAKKPRSCSMAPAVQTAITAGLVSGCGSTAVATAGIGFLRSSPV